MVWKSTHGNNKNSATYYQRLMPTHILSQLIHHSPIYHHDNSQEQSPDHQQQQQQQQEVSTHGYSSGVHIMAVPQSPNNDNDARVAALRGSPQEGTQISYASIAGGSSSIPILNASGTRNPTPITAAYIPPYDNEEIEEEEEEVASHDSPNWSKSKSFLILFGCTLLYSIIAEILVDTVDEVMEDFPMDEKFLGLTLFALVPNITEFMNAISFALYGNIVLSMEIGSAYALQVCLLQIPAMVAFSVWYNYGKEELARFTFR
jgi:Ca2+:H+ antiporter